MNGNREARVGAVLLLGMVVTVLGTLWLQGASFGRDMRRIEALVQEAGQLLPGNAVKVRGVGIGRVREIRVDPTGSAVRVSMEVDGGTALPSDPGILVSPESLFGDWQVEIVSRADYPRYGFLLPPASEAEVLPGFTLPDVSRLTAAADEIAQNITTLTDRVEVAFTEDTALRIRDAIRNFEEVSRQLAVLVDQQGNAIRAVTDEVGRAAVEVGGAAASVDRVFDAVDARFADGTVDSILAETRAAVARLRELSDEVSGTNARAASAVVRTDSTMAAIGRIATGVEAGEGSLGRLAVNDSIALRAEAALAELAFLLRDLQENPRKYIRLSIF